LHSLPCQLLSQQVKPLPHQLIVYHGVAAGAAAPAAAAVAAPAAAAAAAVAAAAPAAAAASVAVNSFWRAAAVAAAAAAAAAAASQAPSMAAAAADKAAAKLVPVAPKCGVRFVSLGLSPMHQVDDSHFTHSKELHNTFNRMFKTGAAFYPFKVSTHLGHGCELQPPPGTVWLYHCKSQLWMIKFEE